MILYGFCSQFLKKTGFGLGRSKVAFFVVSYSVLPSYKTCVSKIRDISLLINLEKLLTNEYVSKIVLYGTFGPQTLHNKTKLRSTNVQRKKRKTERERERQSNNNKKNMILAIVFANSVGNILVERYVQISTVHFLTHVSPCFCIALALQTCYIS